MSGPRRSEGALVATFAPIPLPQGVGWALRRAPGWFQSLACIPLYKSLYTWLLKWTLPFTLHRIVYRHVPYMLLLNIYRHVPYMLSLNIYRHVTYMLSLNIYTVTVKGGAGVSAAKAFCHQFPHETMRRERRCRARLCTSFRRVNSA